MSETEYDPLGQSNSSFQVGPEISFRFVVAICRFNVFSCIINV